MELSNEQIKDLSVKEIFRLFFPMIKKLYHSVRYLEISREEYFKIVLKEINDTIRSYDSPKSYEEYIKNRVQQQIIKREKELLDNTSEVYKVVSNYINLYFKEEKMDYYYSKKSFKQFINILSIYDLLLNPELIEELLKISKFNNAVKIIVDKCLPNLSIQKINKICNDYNFLLIIEAYAIINGIEIIKDEENEDNNSYSFDEGGENVKEISKDELSYEDCKKYYEMYLNGDMSARDKLIDSHKRLVISIAKTRVIPGIELMDLIQYGNEGLLKALEKYDPNMGVKFITYAAYWIRQYINRSIMINEKTIKYPVGWYSGIKSFIKNYNLLANELDREPTDEDMSERFNIPITTIKRYRQVMQETKSLNELVKKDQDGDKEFGEFVLHTDNDEVENEVIKKELKSDISRAFKFARLSEREIAVLKMRYGLYDTPQMTLKQIADIFHVSEERIQQIEKRAKQKMKDKQKSRNLLSVYLGHEPKPNYEMLVGKNYEEIKKNDTMVNNHLFTICDSVMGIKDSNRYNERVKKKARVKTFWD